MSGEVSRIGTTSKKRPHIFNQILTLRRNFSYNISREIESTDATGETNISQELLFPNMYQYYV